MSRQLGFLELAVSQAKAAYELSVERYESGLTGLITVLNSQNQWFDSQSQYLLMKRLRIESRLRLILALGGTMEIQSRETGQS